MNRISPFLVLLGVFGIVPTCASLAQSAMPFPFTFIPISDGGTVTVNCGDVDPIFFTDDNSGSSSFQEPYSNQNHTITLCPDAPGEALSLAFLVFSLETGVAAADNDVLYIYDGDNTSAPLVGTGEDNSLANVTITASDVNPTGCITIEFVVNSGAFAGNQGWVAQVTCETPCAYPNAAIAIASPAALPGDPGTVGLCIGEEVTLDGSGSLPGSAGIALDSLIWNWGDGTTEAVSVLDGFVQSHVYAQPGTYSVSLVVQDAVNCSSINLTQVDVVAATAPVFNSEVTSPLCVDAPGVLDGTPVSSEPWTFQPTVGVSENASLPDATGVTFTSELVIDAFESGQTLDDCNHLELITANIEHSFLGDLTMSVTCPNGTSVVLLENALTSGSVTPDPNGCNLNTSGTEDDLNYYGLGASDSEGYDYSWNMDALYVIDGVDNPFTVDNPPVTLPNGTTIQSGLILPETYLPCGNFCDFLGCPLNGTWAFNVLDQWPLDDGTLFGWSMAFSPDIAPEITTFEPSIGQGADSSFWHVAGDINSPLTDAVDGVEAVSADGNVVDVLFDTPGTYEFGYYAVNEFGCSRDTTVAVEVIEFSNELLSAGPDLGFCDGPIQLLGSFESEVSATCASSSGIEQYCWGPNENTSFEFCPDVPGDGTMMTLNLTHGTLELGVDVLTVFDGPNDASPILATLTGDVSGQTFMATNPDGCLFMTLTSDGACDCASDDGCDLVPLQWCTHCGDVPGECDYNFLWEPADALNDPTLLQPTLTSFDGNPMTFVLTMTSGAIDVCATSDTMVVGPGFEYLLEIEQTSCAGDDGEAIVDVLGNPTASELPFEVSLYLAGVDSALEALEWTGDAVTFEGLTPGDYEIVLSNALGCTYEENFTIDVPEVISDPNGVLDYIDVRLESSPTQFLNALGLPEEVNYDNGTSFPLQSWIDLQGTGLFSWEGGPVDAVAFEGCSDGFVRVIRDPAEAGGTNVVTLQWGGEATLGLDFSTAVQTVVLSPGEVEAVVPLLIEVDGEDEGVEDVIVEYEYVDECGGNVSNESRMVILDPLVTTSEPGVVTCGDGMGMQMAQFNNIQGFGPFMYQWGEAPLAEDAPWLDLPGLNVSEVLPAQDPTAESSNVRTFELALMDQCGQVNVFSVEVAQPELYDTQFCVDTTVMFPALNPEVPISDLLVGGQSLLTSNILTDTLSINATWTGNNWVVEGVTTGGFDWTGLVTLLDTCGQTSTAEWHILEYPCTPGCTQSDACNYFGEAAIEDGSCVFPGDECEAEEAEFQFGVLNDDCECVESFDGVVDEVLDVLAHPNPTKGMIRVTANLGSGQIVCRTMDGRIVHQVPVQNFRTGVEVSLPLSAGMYLLELASGDRHLMRRVIVNR